MKNVLVIGSTGQIGSELTMKLRGIYGGNIVAGYIPGQEPKGELLESGPSAIVDITNEQQIAETVSKYKVDTIYNLAALLSAVAEAKPQLAWKIGMGGLFNVLEVAREMNDLPESLKGKVKGGGSLTALPIIETQAGDVSAYIPTNVISITDGQIFLDTDLFNQGNRPAINVGISVSRVGGNAQIKAMKKVAGTLKIDQAQYRELEAFTKFSGDMDPVTALTIDKGQKNTRLLVQPQYTPMPVEKQIAILYCGTHGLLKDVPLDKVSEFEHSFLEFLERDYQMEVLNVLKTGVIDDNICRKIEETAAKTAKQFM